jgi:pimeloyl-ACP methyl ester carboxylesterase
LQKQKTATNADPNKVAMKTNLRGIDLFYDDVGRGPAIVLLHGYPFNRSMWQEQMDFLSARDYRCIAPDLRGLGETSDKLQLVADAISLEPQRQAEAPGTFTTMSEMARDVAGLLGDLKIENAMIVGLSMGSYVALEFIHLFRVRVRALVLAGARAQAADEAEKRSREEQAQRVLAEGMGFAVDSILQNLLASRTFVDKYEVVARVREMILGTDPRGAAAAQRGMALRRDYADNLHEINVPTLIIAGREDGVRKPEDAQFLHHRIPNSQIEIIDDAGHLMNLEQPDMFNQTLLAFLKLIH